MKFSDKLQMLRKQKGLSQEELGEKLNVTRQTVSKWELGQSKPDTDTMLEISKLFEVSIAELTDEENTLETSKPTKISETNELKPRKWLLVVLIVLEIVIFVVLVNKIIIEKDKDTGNSKGIFGIFEQAGASLNKVNQMSFNSEFEMYDGTQSGYFISSLFDAVVTNNKKNTDKLVTLKYSETTTTDPTEIKNIKKEIKTDSTYEVTLDYDVKGYVNEITIELLNTKKKSQVSTTFFNAFFDDTTESGISIKHDLDNITTSNSTYEEHQISVVYGDIVATTNEEIRNLKSRFEDWGTKYNVWYDYDTDGYVYQMHIEKAN